MDYVRADIEYGPEIAFSKLLQLGKHVPSKVRPCFRKMVAESIAQAPGSSNSSRLQTLTKDFADIFWVKLGQDPPCDINPIAKEIEKRCQNSTNKTSKILDRKASLLGRKGKGTRVPWANS